MTQETETAAYARAPAPIQQPYAKPVRFIGRACEDAYSKVPTSVEIFAQGGKWYCRVRRGDEKTQPMGPYTKHQAERIQNIRSLLLAKKGTARLVFEQA